VASEELRIAVELVLVLEQQGNGVMKRCFFLTEGASTSEELPNVKTGP
jgi:hypothetical protein